MGVREEALFEKLRTKEDRMTTPRQEEAGQEGRTLSIEFGSADRNHLLLYPRLQAYRVFSLCFVWCL